MRLAAVRRTNVSSDRGSVAIHPGVAGHLRATGSSAQRPACSGDMFVSEHLVSNSDAVEDMSFDMVWEADQARAERKRRNNFTKVERENGSRVFSVPILKL